MDYYIGTKHGTLLRCDNIREKIKKVDRKCPSQLKWEIRQDVIGHRER